MGEPSSLCCCFFLFLFLFLLFFRDFYIIFHFLWNNNFSSFFEFFIPFFIVRRIELLDRFKLFLLSFLYFLFGIFRSKIITIRDQILTCFNFLMMRVAINIILLVFLKLLSFLFFLFLSFFLTLFPFFTFLLPFLELFLSLFLFVLSLFLLLFFFSFSLLDLLFFLVHHLDVANQIEIVFIMIEFIKIVIFELGYTFFHILNCLFGSINFFIVFSPDLLRGSQFSCIDILIIHFSFYLIDFGSDFANFMVFFL